MAETYGYVSTSRHRVSRAVGQQPGSSDIIRRHSLEV